MCAHKKISSISYSYSLHAKHNRDMNTFQTLKPNDKVIEHLAGTAKWIIHSRPQQLPACAPSSPWECSLPPTPTHYSNFPDLPPPLQWLLLHALRSQSLLFSSTLSIPTRLP